MTEKLPRSRVLLSVIALFFSLHVFSQLPAFSFTVTKVDQTCLNNGVLNFAVSGLQPGATVTYAVYLLPDTTNAVITTTNTNVPGRAAGNYTIIATQSLNGQTSTNTQNITINNLIIPLTYSFGHTPVRCGNDGVITLNVTSGYPATYETIAGPVIKPPQASNVLTGLPPGLYSVRVTDTCGEAEVVSITVTQATTGIIILDPNFETPQLPGCNSITVSNPIGANTPNIVFYPVTVQYTIIPPGGGTPIVITVPNVTDGDLDVDLPYYNNQQYSYSIKITDACGNVFTKNSMTINQSFGALVQDDYEGCGNNFFFFQVNNFVGPVNVNFTNSPPGFVPGALNINHPTFSVPLIQYGGNGAYVPEGDYTAVLTDGCGRVTTLNFTIDDEELDEPTVSGDMVSCEGDGTIGIAFPDRDVASVILTSAPTGFPGPFPLDVSAGINAEGIFEIVDLIPGTYVFLVTDECGNEYEVTREITSGAGSDNITVLHRSGCELGFGSVRIASGLGLSGLVITAAPAAFTETLPFNALAYKAPDDRFYMNSLPAGSYTVQGTNICGQLLTHTFTVTGYGVSVNTVDVIKHCGSFDIFLQHISNGNYVPTYYLQRFDPVTGNWENPLNGTDYIEGTPVNSLNSIPLTNNQTTLSLAYTGDFRVLKTFFIYDNASVANIRCFHVLHTFSFGDGPEIIDAYSFPCAGGLTEVAVIAEGVPPLTYSITSKEGQPFVVNNGESNLFTGLESATYNFRVTDICGNIRNILLDIDALEPIAILAEGFCEGEDSRLFVPEFTFLEYKWYKDGAPGTVLSTTGTLNFPDYESATDAGVYHLSVTSDNPLSCMNQELSFSLLENTLPDAGDDMMAQFCNDGEATDLRDFLADGIATNGVWEDVSNTGMLTNNTLTTTGLPEGTYQFRYVVSGLCNLSDEAILTLEVKNIPQAPSINTLTPVCEGGDLQLETTVVAGVTYEWKGPNGFTSADESIVIAAVTQQNAGVYTLTATSNGCTSVESSVNVVINPLPRAGEDALIPLCNEGNSVDLTNYLSGAFDTDGVWEDVNASGALTGNAFAIDGIAEGTYQFRYLVTNVCNDTDEAIIEIQLKDIPDAPVLNPVDAVCEGTDVQLSAEPVANATYQWTGPNGFTSAEQNPLIAAAVPLASGDYSLSVLVNGCTSAVTTVPVTVNALPQFTVEGNTVLCEGQTSLLTVMPGNFNGATASYQWYLEGNLLTDNGLALPISGIGNYEVIVTNADCTSNREITVVVNDNPFELELGSGCMNYDYMLWIENITEISGATVVWTGPQNFTFTGLQANITNRPAGDYTATVTNDEGCTAVATITIDNTSCIIPKGVSPNGDGLNDTFDLSNLDVIELKIFNRYGLKVYEAHNYLNEWHGQSDKGTLPTATYYYIITLSEGKQVTGWVYLQREE
ncbi:MAG: hypothetical protein DI539_03845 [Flavobacterium psychrophilum]|nr:MAG: hypothetical protein DI539_03845 [Flavobacterium psychrophilum]